MREALCRRLGKAATKKLPLLQSNVNAIISRQLGQNHKLDTLLTCFHIALMYEGCLRWHDLAQICFGDIIFTETYLRIFIQSAKTDAYRQGQWVTVAVSAAPTTASTLPTQVLETLSLLWSSASPRSRTQMVAGMPRLVESSVNTSVYLPLTDVPITFAIGKDTGLPAFSRTVSYQSYLRTLKTWALQEGLRAEDIGTHSLHRGITSDWALLGIPNRLRREHGRWKSERVSDGYIDEMINIHLILRAFQVAWEAHQITVSSAEADTTGSPRPRGPTDISSPAGVLRLHRQRTLKRPYDSLME